MKVAIIGAGVCGLITLKYAKESGHQCDVFEQTGESGGTWVYTDKHGLDENGLPISRKLYQGLITNSPKEIMEFLNFRYSSVIKDSYITQPLVLKYLHEFADKFDLDRHIQYYSYVTKVEPHEDRWTVTVMDVKRKEERSEAYDAVFICNGSYAHPRMPEIKGEKLFKGLLFHSRDYRNPKLFVNQRVLVVGGAYSAVDISRLIIPVAQKVCVSHHKALLMNLDNAILKPGIKELYEDGAVFIDGSKEDFDIILYCTGYNHFYPFLTEECGITVEDSCVRYLYKHVINIERPTLFFIGIPTLVGAFIIADLQARFAVAALDGKFTLPPKAIMLEQVNNHFRELKEKHMPSRYFHNISLRTYMNGLCRISGIEPFPEVKVRMHDHVFRTLPTCKRNTRYVVLDDEEFIEI